jgi:aspartyl-tRNA(Asn)/glutamyl-tRNA(Gln) amidotransferase subunit C
MDIRRVASVAHISLSEEETDRYARDIAGILDLLNEIDGSPEGEGRSMTPTDVADVLREDISSLSTNPDELMKDMMTYENYVRGPRLL